MMVVMELATASRYLREAVIDSTGLTEEELVKFCTGRISTFKIPRYWKFVAEFPMTVTGKIQKFKMREIAVRELGSE